MDVVYIEGLNVQTLIGVYDFERDQQQTLLLDIRLSYDCLPAGETDDFTLALDYDLLSRTVRSWAEQQSFKLIETFAEQLCVLIFEKFDVADIALKINKPAAVEGCTAVGIEIKRQRTKGKL